jgi:hypothetical protein
MLPKRRASVVNPALPEITPLEGGEDWRDQTTFRMEANPAMSSISPVAPTQLPVPAPAVTAPATALDPRRRRRAVGHVASQAAAGAALVAGPANTQQLPMTARVSVRGHLLYPIVGAVIGTLLLGLPGTFIGAGVGFLLG